MAAASPPPGSVSPLRLQARADLFSQLGVMEKSGLPAIQAFGLLRLPAAQERVTSTRKWLARGSDIATAGRRAGLFTELECTLISAATSAGSPAPIYKRLAEFYTQRANQVRAVKSRLALPGLTLLIALFVQPLPALVGGTLGVGAYLLHCFAPLLVIAALLMIGTNLLRVQDGPPSALRAALENLLMRMPLFGKRLIRRNIRDYFESLGLMLEAGMPILQALPKALKTIQFNAIKTAFAPVQEDIERGASLAQALAGIRYLADGQALALIGTGEASGSLPEMLFRHAALETSAIAHFDQQAAEWLPRIIYAAVAAWVAYGILSGPGVGADLPPELR